MKVDRIFTYLLVSLVPSVIVSFALNSVVLVCSSILAFWMLRKDQSKIFPKKYLLFNAFTVSIVIGMFIDLFQSDIFDLHLLIKRMGFLLMPLIILPSSEKTQRLSLKVYVYFLTLLSSIFLFAGLFRAFMNNGKIIYGNWDSDTTEQFYKNDMILNWGELSYHRLFLFFDMHPSYYALFSLIAIVILIFSNIFHDKKTIKWLMVLVHGTMMVLLSSKAGIVSLLAVFFVYLLQLKHLKHILVGVMSFLILLLIISKIPSTEIRLKSAIDAIQLEGTQKGPNSTSERMTLWKTVMEINKWELATGYGQHGARQKIIDLTGIDKNMHNQFLQSLLDSGLLGLFLTVLFIISPLFSNKNVFTGALVLVILINLLFENMLDRVWGIIPVSFFYGLIIFGSSELTNFDKTIKSEP